MEYKLSSFKFSSDVSRDDKHHVIKKINSIRSKCPSDSSFTGAFSVEGNMFSGEIKVLFSKGTFLVSETGTNMGDLVQSLLNRLEDQISCWKSVRFDQPETFIDYNEFMDRKAVVGS